MSQEQADEILQGLSEYIQETTSSKAKALAALKDAGLINDNGEPEAPYTA